MAKKINYQSRNFADVRTELLSFVKQYYPDIFNDYNDASVGMMLLELNAAVGDMLSFHTDRMFQETQIDFAQERSSILSMARTFGLKVPGKRPSVTICDFSVVVPVFGDTFDVSYCPIIEIGAQVSGGVVLRGDRRRDGAHRGDHREQVVPGARPAAQAAGGALRLGGQIVRGAR